LIVDGLTRHDQRPPLSSFEVLVGSEPKSKHGVSLMSVDSHVRYTSSVESLNEPLVKVHRVFSSHSSSTVSSRLLQFRKVISQDSEGVVTPLMHDHNYWTRNYATLARSRLPRPFT